MLALSTKLKAGALTLPLVALLRDLVGVALAALDLDGLDRFVGVIGIPILSGFRTPHKELLNVIKGPVVVNFNPYTARPCVPLSREGSGPDCRGPRNDVAIIRSSLWRHIQQPIGQRFRAEKHQY